MRIWKIFFVSLFLVLLTIGCSQSKETSTSQNQENGKTQGQNSTEPQEGGTITVASGADLTILDLHKSTVLSDRIPLLHVQEMLVTIDENMKVVPMLAKDWEVSDDNQTVTFNLREGVPFHNGNEMKAEDVKYSIERFIEVSPRKTEFSMVDSIEVVDDYTVAFHLKNPSGVFLGSLANPFNPAVIIPKSSGANGEDIKEPIGTGPFKFEKWEQGKQLVLKKFEDYQPIDSEASGFGGKKTAYVDEVIFKPISEASVRLTALETGEVDLVLDILPKDYDRLKQKQNLQVSMKPSMNWGMLQFGMKKPPFDDPKMRKAVAYALNKQEIVNVATRKLGEPAPSPVFPGTEWSSDVHQTDYKQDIEKAKKLVKEAGYNGEPITISTSTAYDHHEKTALVMQSQLKKIGLNVKVDAVEWASFISDKWVTGDYHLLNGHITPRPDPNQIYYAYLHSSSSYNGYKSEEMDALLEKGITETDLAKRKEIYEEVQSLLQEDLSFMSLYFYPVIEAYSPKVQGYETWSAGYPRLWNVWLND
ncbi:ABC transporter substrate-binding protein [Bacillus marinisedimentorum]|uniref:ABC transporter substrate-binding protein n=1 Tax=Bacillus marinisedimentorum TaxID=1821260 RepID=UPI0007DF836D|nr:ABC transporter substrate-binding protein [Bacillus marinisedimentorum]